MVVFKASRNLENHPKFYMLHPWQKKKKGSLSMLSRFDPNGIPKREQFVEAFNPQMLTRFSMIFDEIKIRMNVF